MTYPKLILSAACVLAACLFTSDHADAEQDQFLAIYPVFSYWKADDACTYDFVLDGTGGNAAEPMMKVTAQLIGKDSAGKAVANLVLFIPVIGGNEADRYKHASVEAPCSIQALSINAATADIVGKYVDLLKANVISLAPPAPPPKMSVQPGKPAASVKTFHSQSPAASGENSQSPSTATDAQNGTDNVSLADKARTMLKMTTRGPNLLPCTSPQLQALVIDAVEQDFYDRGGPNPALVPLIEGSAKNLQPGTSPHADALKAKYDGSLDPFLVCETVFTKDFSMGYPLTVLEFINPNTGKVGGSIEGYLQGAVARFGSVTGIYKNP